MTEKLNTRYTLQQMNALSFAGFNYELNKDTVKMINYLTEQIGSSSVVTEQQFHKREREREREPDVNGNNNFNARDETVRKRKGNKNVEVTSDDWDSLRSFQTTKIEQKTGVDAEINQIRMHLNKLTDKSFLDIMGKLVTSIDKILLMEPDTNILASCIGDPIYDIASSNKFYSKIYADLYVELINKYGWLRQTFDNKFRDFIELFKTIEYFDPDKNYDKFCDMNKLNDKRRANTMFAVNLALNQFIPAASVTNILKLLVEMIQSLILVPDKKNEVDELTENVALLFNAELLKMTNKEDLLLSSGASIESFIKNMAKSKSKDYKSLSNKAIFKYMDLIEV